MSAALCFISETKFKSIAVSGYPSCRRIFVHSSRLNFFFIIVVFCYVLLRQYFRISDFQVIVVTFAAIEIGCWACSINILNKNVKFKKLKYKTRLKCEKALQAVLGAKDTPS